MLLTKSVKVKWNNDIKKWYEEKGYKYTKNGDELEVNVKDLPYKSGVKVKVQCDNKFCNKESIITYQTYNENIAENNDGKYYCNKCSRILGRNCDSKGNIITLNEHNERICNVANCEKKHEAGGYCSSHYKQVRKYGHVLTRTYRDRNIIITYDNYAELILENIKCEEVGRAMIDIFDIEKCKPYSWHLCKNGYVTAFVNNKQVYLHRFIMNINNSKIQIDHINRNRSDNRKENLRFCTNAENGKNKRVLDSNTSGHVGIRYDKRRNYWYASIEVNGKNHYLGSSKNIEEVVKLREKAELQYYGEFASHFSELILKYPEYYIYLIENDLIYNNTYN